MDVNRQRYKEKVMQKLGITPECKQRLKPPAEMNSSLSLSALPDASLIASLKAALWPFFFLPPTNLCEVEKKNTQNAEAVAGSKNRRRRPVRSHIARVIKSKERGSRVKGPELEKHEEVLEIQQQDGGKTARLRGFCPPPPPPLIH